MIDLEMIFGSVMIGAAVGTLTWSSTVYVDPALSFVERDFRQKFRRLRLSTKNIRNYLYMWLLAVVALLIIVWIGMGLPVLGVAIAAILFCLPWYLVRRMAQKRKEKIEDQLADSMVSLSSSIRAGLSLAQAMEILARQCPWPIKQEFQQLYGEYQMGKDMDQCMIEAKERLQIENFALFTAAMEASRKSGGKLNETVERIAHSVRELQRLERKVQSETSQARTSAFYMALAPIAVLAVYYFILDPKNTQRLFTTVAGQLILVTAAILNIVAYLWARAILNPEI